VTTAPDRRAHLLAARERLYGEQAAHAARLKRQQELADFLSGRGEGLRSAGIAFQLLWPEDDALKGPLTTYPIGFASVHWDLVPHASWDMTLPAYLRHHLQAAFSALGVEPATRIIVDLCVGGEPRVLLQAGDFLTHAPDLAGFDTWIYDPLDTWLIEIYHDGTLTYASHPGNPEHAGDKWRPRQRS
jgi:hypothetical protein